MPAANQAVRETVFPVRHASHKNAQPKNIPSNTTLYLIWIATPIASSAPTPLRSSPRASRAALSSSAPAAIIGRL